MRGDQGQDDARKLRPLRFVDRHAVRQRELIALHPVEGNVAPLEIDRQGVVNDVQPRYLPDVTVEHFFIVIVLRLHDLVTHAENLAKQGFFGFELGGGIEGGLQAVVEGTDPRGAAVHRCEDLDVPDGVEPEFGRNPFGDDVNGPIGGGGGFFGREEIEVGGGLFGEFRELTLVDAVGVGDDLGLGGLPEDGIEPGNGGHATGDHVPQHVPRPYGGELIDIPHKEQVRAVFEGFEQTVGEDQIEHGGFIYHEEVYGEGVFFVWGEAARGGVVEHPMDGGGGVAGGFGEAFGGAPGGGGEGETFVVRSENGN